MFFAMINQIESNHKSFTKITRKLKIRSYFLLRNWINKWEKTQIIRLKVNFVGGRWDVILLAALEKQKWTSKCTHAMQPFKLTSSDGVIDNLCTSSGNLLLLVRLHACVFVQSCCFASSRFFGRCCCGRHYRRCRRFALLLCMKIVTVLFQLIEKTGRQ